MMNAILFMTIGILLIFIGSKIKYIIPQRLKQVNTAKKRINKIVKLCGCVAFCPNCKDPLNDQAIWKDDNNNNGLGTYKCNTCGNVSLWHFAIAPGPICLIKNL